MAVILHSFKYTLLTLLMLKTVCPFLLMFKFTMNKIFEIFVNSNMAMVLM